MNCIIYFLAIYYLVIGLVLLGDCQGSLSTTIEDDGRSNDCGVTVYDKGNGAGRVIGGRYADLAEFPWMAKLDIRSGGQNYICGGSLIDNQWILTAAHCFKLDNPITRLDITLGQLNVSDSSEPGIQKRTANSTSVFIHPNFTSNPYDGSLDMDYTLVKLNQPVTFSPYVRAICFPTTCDTPGAANADRTNRIDGCSIQVSSAGWGFTEDNIFSKKLKTVGLAIYKREDCRSAIGITSIGDAQICAGRDDPGQDTCKGDSGGPLMCKIANKTVIVGIVSYGGVQCGEQDVPAVYSRVCEALRWIKTTIGAVDTSSLTPTASPRAPTPTQPTTPTRPSTLSTSRFSTRTPTAFSQCAIPAVDNGFYQSGGKILDGGETARRGTTIILACEEGYFPSSRDISTCSTNGQWSPSLNGNACTMYMPSPSSSTIKKRSSTSPTTLVRFTVRSTQPPSQCRIRAIEHGQYYMNGGQLMANQIVSNNNNVELRCNDGFILSQEVEPFFECQSAQWYPELPTRGCIEDGSAPIDPVIPELEDGECSVPRIRDGLWTIDEIPIDFESVVGPGTKVSIECYNNPRPSPSTTLCRSGSWFPPISSFTCGQTRILTAGDGEATSCGPDEFACATGGTCYSQFDACNGSYECQDGTDENSC